MNTKELLANANLKSTPIRIDIVNLLKESDHLLSAQDIYIKLINNNSKTNLSTVYRNIEKLVESEIISAVHLQIENQVLYEFNQHKHHHFLVCESCHKVETVYQSPVDEYEKELSKKHEFKVKSRNIEFYGTCKECDDD